MSLYDILACPICKTSVEPTDDCLHCTGCGREYPVVDGVPIMLPDWEHSNIEHEGESGSREGYNPWIHRMIVQSLADNQVVIDAGSGSMILDDPCIIRLDIKLTPYVDVVGDLHALPFKPDSIDFIFALAVFEHLRQPFVAAEEIFTALRPGGYVYAESNFVYPYHGCPHHYFNLSIHGLQQVFSQFTELRVGVAPYQMPSFAIESLLNTYLAFFEVEKRAEAKFVRSVRNLFKHPLRRLDAKFTKDTAFRIAAGGYFLGIKQPNGNDTIIPPAILDIYLRTPELQTRYPNPNNLAVPDNLMIWAKTEGRHLYEKIATYFSELPTFSKYTGPSRPVDRSKVKNLPVIKEPDHQSWYQWMIAEKRDDRSILEKVMGILTTEGPMTLAKKTLEYLRWQLENYRFG